ncbi:MAG: hypothetical protein Q8L88_05615 [Bacteroidota bacterium]|nr:hypothetical protein [Bacteroidota bacterium]
MKIIFAAVCIVSLLHSQQLQIIKTPSSGKNGTELAKDFLSLGRIERENLLYAIILEGQIPNFLHTLVSIQTTATINEKEYTLEYFVIPDYLSIGNDGDYFLCPMTPLLAQRIANTLDCILPTKKMVDQIYTTAVVKLSPQPIPPDSLMTTVSRFIQHNDSVQLLRKTLVDRFPLGSLVAGTKKDIIIHQKIYSELKPNRPKPVVIYGWHKLNGEAIQPPNNWHQETYVDYSHGVRLVQKMGKINGADISLVDILQDETYHVLISDTVLVKPYYNIPDQ